MEHIQQFVNLLKLLSDVHLAEKVPDENTWKFTNNGNYTASSEHTAMQFQDLSLLPSVLRFGRFLLEFLSNLHLAEKVPHGLTHFEVH
jgi:hypothetical protein